MTDATVVHDPRSLALSDKCAKRTHRMSRKDLGVLIDSASLSLTGRRLVPELVGDEVLYLYD